MGQFEIEENTKCQAPGMSRRFPTFKRLETFQLLNLLLVMLTKEASEAEYKEGMNNYRADRYSCIGIQAVE